MLYRAVFLETGEEIAVRRFFPFGAEGRGLSGEERLAFEIGLQRIERVTHPAMRAVLAGGCDAVDGLPFVATEWIEGRPLAERLAEGPLASKEAVPVLMKALEVSEVLSQLLAEEAVWVETEPGAILLSEAGGREITFGFSPFKWLGTDDGRRGLKSIAHLTEELMGWRNKLINDQAGNGLAGWLKWLKQNGSKVTLAEARVALATATGAAPPPPTSRLVTQSVRPAATRPVTRTQPADAGRPAGAKRPSLLPAMLTGTTVVAVLAGVGWTLMHGELPFAQRFFPKQEAKVVERRKSALDFAPPIVPREEAEEAVAVQAAAPVAASADAPEKVYPVSDPEALLKLVNREVTVEGRLERVNFNKERTQIFLEFEKETTTHACGFVVTHHRAPGLSEEDLKALIGKKIRISGKVGVGAGRGGQRPKVQVVNRGSITVP